MAKCKYCEDEFEAHDPQSYGICRACWAEVKADEMRQDANE